MECTKVCSGVRKVKKKQVKDELDRFKQAEKKKRRLEKALATSAAIRAELEKKKLMKQEEQKRLEEEGAAIAEAVALRVLDDSSNNMLERKVGFEPLEFDRRFDRFTGGTESALPHQDLSRYSPEVIGRDCNAHNRAGYMWNECSSKWRQQGFCPQYHGPSVRDLHRPYLYEKGWGTTDVSAGVIAEQAISSLRIAEDEYFDTFRFNPMLRW